MTTSGHVRTVGEQSRRVLRDVRELGSAAVDTFGRSAQRLRRRGREVLAAGRERAMEAETELERYVGQHPIRSLLVAVGIGALIGLALRRRPERDERADEMDEAVAAE